MRIVEKSIKLLTLSVLMLAVQALAEVAGAQDRSLRPYRDWFGSYGYVDTVGNIVIDCQFDDAR